MLSYYESIIKLPNECWIGKIGYRYDFWYKKSIILTDCIAFYYISEKIIVLKKDDVIHVFSTNIIVKDNYKTVEKLAEVSIYSNISYIKLNFKYYFYLVNSNGEIKYYINGKN